MHDIASFDNIYKRNKILQSALLLLYDIHLYCKNLFWQTNKQLT